MSALLAMLCDVMNLFLSGLKWTPNPKSVKFQYEDPTGKLMMLPSDLVLIEDTKFKEYVGVSHYHLFHTF